MKLGAAMVAKTLDQLDAKVIPDNHPAANLEVHRPEITDVVVELGEPGPGDAA